MLLARSPAVFIKLLKSFRIVLQQNESRLELKKQIPASLFKGV
jgi:hypothetical protein